MAAQFHSRYAGSARRLQPEPHGGRCAAVRGWARFSGIRRRPTAARGGTRGRAAARPSAADPLHGARAAQLRCLGCEGTGGAACAGRVPRTAGGGISCGRGHPLEPGGWQRAGRRGAPPFTGQTGLGRGCLWCRARAGPDALGRCGAGRHACAYCWVGAISSCAACRVSFDSGHAGGRVRSGALAAVGCAGCRRGVAVAS